MVNTSVCRTDIRRFESDPCLFKKQELLGQNIYTGVRFPSAPQSFPIASEIFLNPSFFKRSGSFLFISDTRRGPS